MAQVEGVTDAAVDAAVFPERAEKKKFVTVAGKRVEIMPMKRRWQALFRQAALPYLRVDVAATEEIVKSAGSGMMDFKSATGMLLDSEADMDKLLDRAAAVVMASQIPGAERDVEATIAEQIAFLNDNSVTDELRELVDAQVEQEQLVRAVGERLPARLLQLVHLTGDTSQTLDSVKQRLTSFFQKSRETSNGAGG